MPMHHTRSTIPPACLFLALSLLSSASPASVQPPRPAEQPASESAAARPQPGDEEHPLDAALRIARKGLKYIREHVDDYTAIIIKRERVNGKLTDYQYMYAKVRNRKVEGERVRVPFSVYLRFLRPPSVAGREVIWVEGKNRGKLIAHEAGFKNLFRFPLDPAGYLAMMGQRYPITEIGIENLVAQLIKKGERDRRRGEVVVNFYKDYKVAKRSCTMIEVTHPVQRPYFDFYRARIYLDDELKVPIRYAAWSWPESEDGEPVLLEEYTYTNLKLNVGLTDKDFDPDNPKYDFP